MTNLNQLFLIILFNLEKYKIKLKIKQSRKQKDFVLKKQNVKLVSCKPKSGKHYVALQQIEKWGCER
ncbi:hypothetical protein BpHYR1_008464 [Brachionus plicatilis]|uniref:Uncharacterized protein n=1 Tax=Brachionus plicatilis TaxID=10195 RepID=A0A3M7SA22_BRAPC|nr:hypothetical protein BpHYR1_008464 [Brachionus plicatilis]